MESWGVKTKKGGTELHVFGPLNPTKYFSAFFGGKAIAQDTSSPGHFFGLHPLIPGNIGIFPEVENALNCISEVRAKK